jgi:hypothetical protein
VTVFGVGVVIVIVLGCGDVEMVKLGCLSTGLRLGGWCFRKMVVSRLGTRCLCRPGGEFVSLDVTFRALNGYGCGIIIRM